MVESIKELRNKLQSIYRSNENPPYSEIFQKYTFWRISIYITKGLLYTNITANQVTLLNILIGVTSSLLLYDNRTILPLLGGMLLLLHHTLDVVDGEIARYRKATSLTGAYLDRITHCIVDPLIFLFIGYGAYKTYNNELVIIFTMILIVSVLMVRLFLFVMYAAIIDAKLRRYYSHMIPTNDHSTNSYLQDYMSLSPRNQLFKIAEFFLTLGIIVTIPLLVLFEQFFNFSYLIFGINYHIRELYIILAGILYPIVWIFGIYYVYRTKSTENLFNMLFFNEDS